MWRDDEIWIGATNKMCTLLIKRYEGGGTRGNKLHSDRSCCSWVLDRGPVLMDYTLHNLFRRVSNHSMWPFSRETLDRRQRKLSLCSSPKSGYWNWKYSKVSFKHKTTWGLVFHTLTKFQFAACKWSVLIQKIDFWMRINPGSLVWSAF